MRLFLVLLSIFAAFVLLGFWTNHSLQVSTEKLVRIIDVTTGHLEKGEWDSALKETTELEKTWVKNAKWWPLLLDHQEMDNIEFAMSKIKEYVKEKTAALSKGQLSELKIMIKHIPEKEAVKIENIL